MVLLRGQISYMGTKLHILVCDARLGDPILKDFIWETHDLTPTVGQVLVALGVAESSNDPKIARKGCFGVFGKRKDWDAPIYDGDRLELYSELLVDPMAARRKKANKDLDARLQAKAASKKGRFSGK
jgi:putative ubiquitin-RnfH superfamily antitoxin RatB of RatAB toxin-antitoxin module